MKITITLEELEKNTFQISVEDDVAITHVTSTSPVVDIMHLLKAAGVKGKRGPKKPKVDVSAN